MKNFLITLFIFLIGFGNFSLESKTRYWNKGRGYRPFRYATTEGIFFDNKTDTLQYDYFSLDKATEDFSLTFRAKNINGHPTKKYGYITSEGKSSHVSHPHWGFFIAGEKDTIVVQAKGGEKMSATEPIPSLDISLYNLAFNKKKPVVQSLTEGINPYDGDNIWKVRLSKGNLIITAGDRLLKEILDTPCRSNIKGFGFFAGWGDKLLISDISIDYSFEEENNEEFSIEDLKGYFENSVDPMEGYWTLFDRELDESLLKLGGFYNLICIKENEGYKFLYFSGASVNSNNWKTGDLKAILTPTPFTGIYDVEWIDSMKDSIKHDIKAQKGEGNTLTIQFPYQYSKFRLRKMSI